MGGEPKGWEEGGEEGNGKGALIQFVNKWHHMEVERISTRTISVNCRRASVQISRIPSFLILQGPSTPSTPSTPNRKSSSSRKKKIFFFQRKKIFLEEEGSSSSSKRRFSSGGGRNSFINFCTADGHQNLLNMNIMTPTLQNELVFKVRFRVRFENLTTLIIRPVLTFTACWCFPYQFSATFRGIDAESLPYHVPTIGFLLTWYLIISTGAGPTNCAERLEYVMATAHTNANELCAMSDKKGLRV